MLCQGPEVRLDAGPTAGSSPTAAPAAGAPVAASSGVGVFSFDAGPTAGSSPPTAAPAAGAPVAASSGVGVFSFGAGPTAGSSPSTVAPAAGALVAASSGVGVFSFGADATVGKKTTPVRFYFPAIFMFFFRYVFMAWISFLECNIASFCILLDESRSPIFSSMPCLRVYFCGRPRTFFWGLNGGSFLIRRKRRQSCVTVLWRATRNLSRHASPTAPTSMVAGGFG